MNSVNSRIISCSVHLTFDAPQVIVFDAAQHINSVIISEREKQKNHFSYDCYLSGHKCTIKVAQWWIRKQRVVHDHKYADRHNIVENPFRQSHLSLQH